MSEEKLKDWINILDSCLRGGHSLTLLNEDCREVLSILLEAKLIKKAQEKEREIFYKWSKEWFKDFSADSFNYPLFLHELKKKVRVEG